MVWALALLPMKFIPHSLTPVIEVDGIRSFVGFGKVFTPLAHRVLYLRHLIYEAIPQYISGRTSYLPV